MKHLVLVIPLLISNLLYPNEFNNQAFEKQYSESSRYLYKCKDYEQLTLKLYTVLQSLVKKDDTEFIQIMESFPIKARLALVNRDVDLGRLEYDNSFKNQFSELAQYYNSLKYNSSIYKVFPISFAIVLKNDLAIEKFLSYGARVNQKTYSGETAPLAPISVAIRNSPEYISLLVSKGVPLNSDTNTITTSPLFRAAVDGSAESAAKLLQLGATLDRHADDDKPLITIACNNHNYDVVKVFLDHGANPNDLDSNQNPPIFWAADNSAVYIAELLLDYGANIKWTNRRGSTVIDWIGKDESVRSNDILTLLRYGAPYPRCDFHQKLIDKALTSYTSNSTQFYKTFLSALLHEKTTEAIEALGLAQGNNLNQATEIARKITVLHWSVIRNNAKATEALLNFHSEKGYITKQLHTYALQLPIFKNVLVHPLILDSRDDKDLTPLMWAARLGHKEIYHLLKKRGANEQVVNKHGKTAKDYAQQYKNMYIFDEVQNQND